jgi:hypothetical protein
VGLAAEAPAVLAGVIGLADVIALAGVIALVGVPGAARVPAAVGCDEAEDWVPGISVSAV